MNRTLWTLMLTGALALPLAAQNLDDGDDPDHGVARLSLLNGEVSVQRGDTGEVIAGELNAPLVALDHVLTGVGSRAEVQLDWANMVRLGPVSEIRLGDLRDGDYLVQVAEGSVTFRILRDTRAQLEISTPTVSIRPVEKGAYRVTVRPDGYTEVTVRGGQAEIFTPRGTEILRNGRTLQARGTPADPEFMIVSAVGKDDFDRWNESRDRDLERSQSYRYVSRDIYGADDLDAYGRWVYDAPYGWVWVPNVATGWAPYRVGRWTWVNYYGWTWLSGDPWGWAPYHYGRWYWGAYGWAWYPGAVTTRYFWRPALVGFFGWGTTSVSVGVGWGWGNIGWVPLAPFEVYRPWYGPRFGGTTVINNITVVNNTNIVNVYRNARQVQGRNGVTSIQANNFGRTRTNNDNYVRVNSNDLARAGHVQGPVPLEQTREKRRFSDRAPAPEIAARATRERPTQFAGNVDRSARQGGGQPGAPAVTTPGAGSRDRGPGGVDRGGPDRGVGDRGGVERGVAERGGVTRGTVDRGTQTAPPSRDASATSSGGWRRFEGGAPEVNRSAGARTIEPTPRSDRGGDSGFAAPRDNRRQATEVTPRTQPEARRQDLPGFSSSGTRRSQPEPVQINPPIVRDRGASPGASSRPSAPPATMRQSAPPVSNPSGGSMRSAPRMDSAPRSAPSMPSGGSVRQSAPSSGGGSVRGASPAPAAPAGGGEGGGGRRR